MLLHGAISAKNRSSSSMVKIAASLMFLGAHFALAFGPEGPPDHPAQITTHLFIDQEGISSLAVNTSSDGIIDSMELTTNESSPLPIDRHLGTHSYHAISLNLPLLASGHPFHPRRLLAAPSMIGIHGKAAAQDISLWQREIPVTASRAQYLHREWLLPASIKGVPMLVEYENGEWGLIEIQLGTALQSTKILYHRINDAKPKLDSDWTPQDFFAQIARAQAWPEFTLLHTQQLSPNAWHRRYLQESINDSGTQYRAWAEQLKHHKRYAYFLELFASKEAQRYELHDAFLELWNLSEQGARIGTSVATDYINFRTSHWALFALLSSASVENLSSLMSVYDVEILSLVRKAPDLFLPQFYLTLHEASDPVRATEVLAIDHFWRSFSLNNPEAAAINEKLTLKLHAKMKKLPQSLFQEILDIAPSDVFATHFFAEYQRHLEQSNSAPHALAGAWLLSLVSAGREDDRMRQAIIQLRARYPKLWEEALRQGESQGLFECRAILRKLPKS